ncbi:hypothetical protein SNEBB_000881 [Seison nebaliae]|nr:hypothetical protein SNEBB_000881 [Seison nebaliae]
MTVVIFVVDTSISMNQMTEFGMSNFDLTRCWIELFVKFRCREGNMKHDRYMLFTTGDPPHNIRVGWKENLIQFNHELKMMSADSLSDGDDAIKQAFNMLNIYRLSTRVDTFGYGFFSQYTEWSMIIFLTDGRERRSKEEIGENLKDSIFSQVPGSELYDEIFRWDQQLFVVKFRTSAISNSLLDMMEGTAIEQFAELTGGECFRINDRQEMMSTVEILGRYEQQLSAIIESESDKYQVSISYDKKIANWCFPEPYWLHSALEEFNARNSHPILTIDNEHDCLVFPGMNNVGQVPTGMNGNEVKNTFEFTSYSLPFDEYELTVKNGKKFSNDLYQKTKFVFMKGSGVDGDDRPFGYIVFNRKSMKSLTLFVGAYDYPTFAPMYERLLLYRTYRQDKKFMNDLEQYLCKTMPQYYIYYLRRILPKLTYDQLLQEFPTRHPTVLMLERHLKKSSAHAKMLLDNFKIFEKRIPHFMGNTSLPSSSFSDDDDDNDDEDVTKEGKEMLIPMEISFNDLNIPNYSSKFLNISFVKREELSQITDELRDNIMNWNLRFDCILGDIVHHCPEDQMGNYQIHMKAKVAPLRTIEPVPERIHTFGNPFKLNKAMMTDEMDNVSDDSTNSEESPNTSADNLEETNSTDSNSQQSGKNIILQSKLRHQNRINRSRNLIKTAQINRWKNRTSENYEMTKDSIYSDLFSPSYWNNKNNVEQDESNDDINDRKRKSSDESFPSNSNGIPSKQIVMEEQIIIESSNQNSDGEETTSSILTVDTDSIEDDSKSDDDIRITEVDMFPDSEEKICEIEKEEEIELKKNEKIYELLDIEMFDDDEMRDKDERHRLVRYQKDHYRFLKSINESLYRLMMDNCMNDKKVRDDFIKYVKENLLQFSKSTSSTSLSLRLFIDIFDLTLKVGAFKLISPLINVVLHSINSTSPHFRSHILERCKKLLNSH